MRDFVSRVKNKEVLDSLLYLYDSYGTYYTANVGICHYEKIEIKPDKITTCHVMESDN